MIGDLVKTILGAGGVTTILLGLIAGIIKLVQHRMQASREDDIDDRDWIAYVRRGIEEHLGWDNDRRTDIIILQNTVNELLIRAGLDPKVWPPIAEAPRLFPNPRGKPSPEKSQPPPGPPPG